MTTSKRKSIGELAEVVQHVPKDSAVHRVVLPRTNRVVDVFADLLVYLGAKYAFGCTGGTIALFCEALARSPLHVLQCRHESGAAFAAAEAYFASGHVSVVFTTSGPSVLNALNGLMAARTEGAKVILVSGSTPPANRGRGAFQETAPSTLPRSIFAAGSLFDYAIDLVDPAELAGVARALREGVSRKGGFVAHIALPSSLQGVSIDPYVTMATTQNYPTPRQEEVRALAAILGSEPFAMWVGFGAREYAPLVRRFMEATGTHVMTSPRGRGIVPEHHPLFLGVTGMSSPWDTEAKLAEINPQRLLVLGSRLGELTSLWNERLIPDGGVIQVDLESDVTRAFPNKPRHLVQSDIGDFLSALLDEWPHTLIPEQRLSRPETPMPQFRNGPVRPDVLMAVLQRVLEESNIDLLVDCGNCFAWANTYLRFVEPRYRVSVSWGSMGQATAGVIGASLASGKPCIALVGDGALLMQNEISTAVRYGVPAIWLVLNDAQYGMIEQGMRGGGLTPVETQIPPVDFVALARSVGAEGIRVEDEHQIERAIRMALTKRGPFVIDVVIDRDALAPIRGRVAALETQGVGRVDG